MFSFALVVAPVGAEAGDGPSFGVAEDASKYADDGGAAVYAALRELGMTANRWTARFTGDPDVIAEGAFLDRAVPVAAANNIRIVLSLYQERAEAPNPEGFCRWAESIARRYPTIRSFVIGNEVNAARFWAPQKTEADPDAGPRSYLAVLTECYDRLKAVDAGITVIGMGLAPRAVNAKSTKPLDFLRTVGELYRESGRETPLMDGLAVHPYPNPNASPPPPPDRGYDDPAFFSLAQLDRVKRALFDAFSGTKQPTTIDGLKLTIGEIGYQTDTSSETEYTGDEVSPVVPPDVQRDYYKIIAASIACDPDIADVFFFHLRDEQSRGADAQSGGWQSGLQSPLGKPKPSYQAVKEAISEGCKEKYRARKWAPEPTPEPGKDGLAGPPEKKGQSGAPPLDLQSIPALATDGMTSSLLDFADVGLAAVQNAAEAIANSFKFDDADFGSMNLEIFELPATWKAEVVWRAAMLVLPTECASRVRSRSRGRSKRADCVLDGTFWDVKLFPRNDRDSDPLMDLRICFHSRGGRIFGSITCKRRRLESVPVRPAQSVQPVLAALGKGTARAGESVRLPIKVVRRPAGVYMMFVVARAKDDPRKVTLLQIRPFVVTARPAIPARWKNCTAVRKIYPNGIGRSGAHDKTKGNPSTSFKRSNALYAKAIKFNKRLDGDRDGIACERVRALGNRHR